MKTLIVLSAFLAFSCRTSTTLITPDREFIKVKLETLISQKGNYHKKDIETEGFYLQASEMSGLFYPIKYDPSDTISIYYNYSNGIWIDFSRNKKGGYVLDSIQKKVITVRGYLDTTLTGHLENYAATLTNAEIISMRK